MSLWLTLLAMETVRPRCFLNDDNAAWFLGAYLHDFRVLFETGRLAEVNYYQHGGEPFIEQGQTAVLYPPVYLGVALARAFSGDDIWTIDWVAAEHLTLGLLGFYFWLRQGGMAAWWAALASLAWVFNPFVLDIGASWIMTTIVAAWLPWLFWALDYLLVRPSIRASLCLGIAAGLLFLQGYVQWFAYSILFLALYAVWQFALRPEARKPVVLHYLLISVLIFAILCLPLLLPMLHAVGDSAIRGGRLSVGTALEGSVDLSDIVPAQLCLFRSHFCFGSSTAILYSPALLFIPVMAFRLYHTVGEAWRRLFVLSFLAVLAIIFSTRCHWLLTMLPLFDKFRWPFKMYLLADFFLVAAFAWAVASWTESRASFPRGANFATVACLTVVVLAHLGVSLAFHDENFLSEITLPSTVSPLPANMDPRLGRVVAFGRDLPDPLGYRYLTYAFATVFDFPSLGGYDPLVSQKQLEYSFYLDFPNISSSTVTAEFQKQLEARSVRYWIVDPHSSQFAEISGLTGLKPLEQDDSRAIFEDAQAAPLVYAAAHPADPCALSYSGNSLLISLRGINSPLSVSVGPTSGWWYRLDGGKWLRPTYQNDRLMIEPGSSARLLEVTYFDTPFREGLVISAALIVLLMIILTAQRDDVRRVLANRIVHWASGR
jgi:hypothetical protein